MTYSVSWQAEATGVLSRFLGDPKGVSAILDATDQWATNHVQRRPIPTDPTMDACA